MVQDTKGILFHFITYFTQISQLECNISIPILQMRHWGFKPLRWRMQKFKPQSLWLHTKPPPLIHNSCFFKGSPGLSALGNPDEKEWIFSYAKWQLFKESMYLTWNENIFFMRNMRSIRVFIFQSPQFTRISLGCFCQGLKNSSLWFFWCELI